MDAEHISVVEFEVVVSSFSPIDVAISPAAVMAPTREDVGRNIQQRVVLKVAVDD
jgi:hypothetical protein